MSLCTNPLADIFTLKAVKPKMRDRALIPIERIRMSPRGGVNRRLKLFLEWLNKGGIKLVFTLLSTT